jgi:hypothetical protein
VLWIATDPSGYSTGGGLAALRDTTWTIYDRSNSGLPSDYVTALFLDQSTKWIGTRAGLARLDSTWTIFSLSNSGLPDSWITAVVLDRPSQAWMGTYRGGLAVYRQGGILSVNGNEQPTGNYLLQQNYPNPFNSSTILMYSLPTRQVISLRVYDITGKEIGTLYQGIQTGGTHTLQWNGTDANGRQLSSGIYFMRLQTELHSQVIKTLLIK